jgi:hypothetical protein
MNYVFLGDAQDMLTILAALAYYHEMGMGEPKNQFDHIHAIASNNDEDVSMDTTGIENLMRRLNKSLVNQKGPVVDVFKVAISQ